MSDTTTGGGFPAEDPPMQPLRDGDTSIDPDDAAQAEWDATTAADAGAEPDAETATGADPAEIPSDDDEVPADDIRFDDSDAETQGRDPVGAELGEDGQGDLIPEDNPAPEGTTD